MRGKHQVMGKYKLIIVTIILSFMLSGCQPNAVVEVKEPDIAQIRSICNLATLECYYHNVAKSTKEADSWLKQDRKFWIEYTGIAKVGIDMSKVKMEINGTNITVTLPQAEVLEIGIDRDGIDENSYISSDDGWVKNNISADDQTSAIDSAQKEMEETVKNNKTLLYNAQSRAQKLIENYIRRLGEISNIQYNIKWIYDDDYSTSITDNTEAG